jgi:hypothetical protein
MITAQTRYNMHNMRASDSRSVHSWAKSEDEALGCIMQDLTWDMKGGCDSYHCGIRKIRPLVSLECLHELVPQEALLQTPCLGLSGPRLKQS